MKGGIARQIAMLLVGGRINGSNRHRCQRPEDIERRLDNIFQLRTQMCEHKISFWAQKRRLLPLDGNSFLPQVVETVKLARFVLKNMDDDIAHVEQDPSPVGFIGGRNACSVRRARGLARSARERKTARTPCSVETLFELDLDAEQMQPLVNAVSHGFDMAGARRGAEHEIVTKIHYFAHIEDNNILRFFIGAEMSSLFGQF